jgi:hypothetical protein
MGRFVGIAIVLAACGGHNAAKKDAAIADARVDTAPACANKLCGATCCATAAYECAPACTCPANIIPQPFSTVITQMDTMRMAPDVLGIGVVSGTDSKLHALVVAFDPTMTPLATDIALPTTPFGGAPFVALGYDVNVSNQTTRSTFFVSQGTLNLTRRCPAGVAGSIRGVTLREQTAQNDPTPAPNGCTLAIPDLSFDYGAACP